MLEDVFGGKNIAVIGIVPKTGDVYQPQVLAKIQRIQAGIEQIPHAVRHNILSFAARKVKVIKGGPEGMEVRPLMDTVPQTPEDIAKLKAAVASMPIYINALVSPDGKAAAIVADFKQDKTIPNFVAMLKDMRSSPCSRTCARSSIASATARWTSTSAERRSSPRRETDTS